jgi:hypothetical protein
MFSSDGIDWMERRWRRGNQVSSTLDWLSTLCKLMSQQPEPNVLPNGVAYPIGPPENQKDPPSLPPVP